MTAIRAIIAVAVALAIATSGCAGSNYRWADHWRGNRNLTAQPGFDPVIARTAGMIDLTMKPDGSFELFDAGAPKTGVFRTSGHRAYLTVKTFFGRPIAEQGPSAVKMNREIELSVQNSDTIAYRDPAGFENRSYDLKRWAPAR